MNKKLVFIGLIIAFFTTGSFAAPFEDLGNGVIQDKATGTYNGAAWTKCSYGQKNDAACSGNAGVLDQAGAVSYCQSLNSNGGFAGRTDWKLPQSSQLIRLVDASKSPKIDTAYFPNIYGGGSYWGSDKSSDNKSGSTVDFSTGSYVTSNLANKWGVRCMSQYGK